jgi:hypothetical protein
MPENGCGKSVKAALQSSAEMAIIALFGTVVETGHFVG